MRRRFHLIAWLLIVVGSGCQFSPLELFAKTDHRELGESALHDQDFDLALAEFTLAIEEDSSDSTLYFLRGSAYYERYSSAYASDDPDADGEDFDRAIADFSEAIELNPRYAEAYNYRALTYAGYDMNGLALADYNMAIDLDPGLATAYYGRGYLFEVTGEYALAIADYRQFLELSEDPYWRDEAQIRLDALLTK